MKNIIAILFLFSSVNMLSAQEKYTLSGYLRDGETGEELLYATVSVPSESQGVTTNLYGFYSLTLPAGTYEVDYSYVGFETTRMTITLDKDIQQNVELSTGSLELEEIVVTAEKKDANVTSTEMSTVALDMKETKLIPVLMGEQDVLKTIQLMPGVSSNSEGNSGFFVRGGNADQNLILLDEAPVYNASHLLGFFSVFNSDALKDVKMYKGGISAEYGGRASSVMDVRMKNGNSKKWNASGGIGLISSRLTVEGPIVKDKGSVMVSGRRTYADVIARPFLDDASDLSLYFYDLNLKANYQISEKDRLYVSGYLGRDVFGTENFGFDWGNTTATLRWNHIFTNKLFSNTTFIYSDYDYGFNLDFSGQKITLSAGIFDYNFKQDFNYYLNPNNTLKFGGQAILHQFKPSQLTFENSTDNEDIAEQRALEGGIYITNDQKVNNRLSLNYGLRLSTFSNIGEYEVKEYNEDNEIVSSTTYDKGEFYNTYIGLEPRVNATYLLTENSSVKASYNRNYQYLHLLSNSTSGTPTDIWTPSTPLIKPQIADQVALGWFKNFKDNKYEFSVEAYYKNLQNQIDYENGADIISNADVEAELVFGKGRAYGMEVYLKKKTGRLTGWLSYTLAKSERQFDPVNNGEWYSARQDRTHDISLVGIYEVSPRFNISASWVYYTGDAVTFPSGKYYVDGALVNLYTERNADRMPEYHRLDLGGTFILKDSKRFYSDLNVSFYNLYNRKNAYTITFQDSETVANASEAVRLSLFGIVPALTWNFKF